MRNGRFAGVSDGGREAIRPLPLSALFRFDFSEPEREADARIAADRARALRPAVPLVAAVHLLWAAVAAVVLGLEEPRLLPALAPLGIALLADLAFWLYLRRRMPAPHRAMRLAFVHVVGTGALWAAAAGIAAAMGTVPALAAAALVAGLGVAVAAYFLVPALLVAGCAASLAGVALLKGADPIVAIAAAICLYLVWLGLFRARDLVFSGQQRLAAEAETKKARRFVDHFEESGRGWFWETNGEGRLAYASERFASQIGRAAGDLLGCRFDELLDVEAGERADEAKKTLGFHLGARFPFADLIVGAEGSDAIWALSGSPVFDAYGRFLGFRGIGTNITEERRRQIEASRHARFDSLTGLPNRAAMRDMLDDALAHTEASKRGCGLMMIDLDKFKHVNDTLGHPVGDQLLKQVAERLAAVLSEEGRVGRLGGDEFEAILPGVGEEGRLAEIAAALVAELGRPFEVEGHDIRIGGSVGVAIARPGRAYASGLIKEADLALYAAKAAGRRTFRFFDPEMHAEAAERQVLESELRGALAKEQLRLLFQPVVETVSEEVVAFEAVLRWHHPTRGVISAAEIVPVAEELGLMPGIGTWAIRNACAEAAKWPSHVRIAVNLSPSQVKDPALPAIVTGALASSGIDPDRLELEITEAVFLADAGPTAAMLERLKALGVRLALDNFGTGRAGLGHLRTAPVDKIKIDRSFVSGAGAQGSREAAIVRAIVVLAESLGMDTTAEGAETIEELALIRRLGCSQVQGFLFGRPVPSGEALALARDSRPPSTVIGFSRPPRHRLIRTGMLEHEGERLPARLRNISAGGAMVECDRPVPVDAKVKLDLEEAGFVIGEVRWCQRGQMGIRFDHEFDLRKLARPRRTPGSLKMMTPRYLEAEAPAPADTPLERKPARRGAR